MAITQLIVSFSQKPIFCLIENISKKKQEAEIASAKSATAAAADSKGAILK